MSVLDRPALVPVPLGFCPCKGEPHSDGDVIYLRSDLEPLQGVRAKSIVAGYLEGREDVVTVNVELAALWLDIGIAEWTFLDDDGEPIPVTSENIALALPYARGGRQVADAADDLYTPMVIDPLVAKITEQSSDGSTPGASQPSANRATRRLQRKRSSTATTGKVPPPG